jgi:hypothetical protein
MDRPSTFWLFDISLKTTITRIVDQPDPTASLAEAGVGSAVGGLCEGTAGSSWHHPSLPRFYRPAVESLQSGYPVSKLPSTVA